MLTHNLTERNVATNQEESPHAPSPPRFASCIRLRDSGSPTLRLCPNSLHSTERAAFRAPKPKDREQFIAYWTTETGWHSDLQLRNNLVGSNLTVTPGLRTPDGVETSLPAITIRPQEVKSVDLEAAIRGTAPELVGTYGSIVLRYRSLGRRNLYASVMIHNVGHPIAFHIDATGELQNYEAASREGIWWLPNKTATDYLILTNQGANRISLTLSAMDTTGKESKQSVTLGPRATGRYSVRSLVESGSLAGSYGGIRIYAPAHAGSLDTAHFLFDQKAGFSALLKMFDHDPNATIQQSDYAQTSIWTLRAPMLALTQPDPALAFPVGTTLHPQIFVRNTTSRPLAAALRFSWRADNATGKSQGPSLQLLPYETRQIDVAAMQDGKILPANAHWTSVTVTTNSKPDEVMAVAVSYDATLRYGAQTPFSDQLSFKWEGGEWQYDAEHNSIMTASNGGTKPALAAFTLFYDHGTQRYDLEQMLQPDEQMWIDVGKLIREHVPDKNGRILPVDLTSGTYEFSDLTDPIIGTLFEGKITYEKTNGHVTYGCSTQCCGDDSVWLKVNPLNLTAGSKASNGVLASTCNGYIADVSPKFYGGRSTADPSIATVDTYGTVTGVGGGSTTTFADGLLPQDGLRRCPLVENVATGSDNVAPPVTVSCTLKDLALGPTAPATTTTGSCAATVNPSGGTYTWSASKNTVSVTSNGSSASYTAANASSSAADTTITVTYTVNGHSYTSRQLSACTSPQRSMSCRTPARFKM